MAKIMSSVMFPKDETEYKILGSMALNDLSESTDTTFTLECGTLTILPDLTDAFTISLASPLTGEAPIYEFIFKYVSGSITLPDNVEFTAITAFLAQTMYDIKIVNNFATVSLIGKPSKIYLFDNTASDCLCEDITGGWYFNSTGLHYRSMTANVSGSKLHFATSTSVTTPLVNVCTKSKLNFENLLNSGYSLINVTFEGAAAASHIRLGIIASSGMNNVTGSWSSANLTSAYEYEKHNEITYSSVVSSSLISLPLSDIVSGGITSGYVTVYVRHNNSGTNTSSWNFYCPQVWIE